MLVQRPNEFRIAIEPALLVDRRPFKPELSDAEARIAFIRLGDAHRDVMLDLIDSKKRGWFCLAVEPGHEIAVKNRLDDFKVNTFVPMENDYIVCRRGQKKIIKGGPIHVGYVLVECATSMRAFLGIEALRDVYRVLGGVASPWRIKDEVIEQYRQSIDAGLSEPEIDDTLHERDEVLVTKGPWVDFRGEIVQVKQSKAKVNVTMHGDECEIWMPLAYFRKL